MKWFLGFVVVAVAGLVACYFYCVNPVMDQFQAAIDSGKPERVAPFMDVAALKDNTVKFTVLRYSRPDVPGSSLTGDQVKDVVDAFVTPENVLLIMKGAKIEPGSLGGTPDANPHPLDKHYEGPDYCDIDVYYSAIQTPDNRVTLVFARNGWFNWKLSKFVFSWN
jgi:hypothetical protein